MVKKVIGLIYDGLGDRPIEKFGFKTPLEAANTPNMDALAKKALCGVANTLGRGVRPGSDVSHLAIFGYPMEQYYTGRGPIEVAGLGIRLQQGDVAFRGNFGTVDAQMNILDRRAGRIRVVDAFAKAIDGIEIDGVKFIVLAGTAHRAGVVMRGPGLSAAITDADPHEEGKPIMQVMPKDDTKEAKFTADVINKFMEKSHKILDAMPENAQRKADGQFPANFLLLRGPGMYPQMPSFEDKYELRACCIAGGGLYKGVGAFLGMDLIEVEGATALPDTNVQAKFDAAKKALNDYDFVFVHVKAADSLAEDGKADEKKDFIEKCDKAMATFLNLPEDVLLFVTADHSTACELKAHTADPVPVMFVSPHARIDCVEAFNERACASGGFGRAEGKDIMPEVMNLMGKLHLIGA